MRTKKLLSFITAAAISVSSFAGLILSASAQSTTYTWDFTDPAYFSETIEAGSDIISDQGETTVIMSNPGAKFNCNTSSADKQVVKAEATVADAMKLVVPEGDSAVLSIELTAGSSGRVLAIVDSAGNIVLTASDYTKNVLKTYTCDLTCGETYYLDSTAYKPYIGKVQLTVTAAGGGEEQPTERPTEQPTEQPTEAQATEAAATSVPGGGEDTPSDIEKLSAETTITMDAFAGEYTCAAVLGGNMKIYAGEGSNANIVVDSSNKTINETKYTSRLKFGGVGSFNEDGTPKNRVIEIVPAAAGAVTVDFAHASSSGEARKLTVLQGGAVIGEKAVAAGLTESFTINVEAGRSVYIYATVGGVNVYGIKYTPGETVTEAPATEVPTDSPTDAPISGDIAALDDSVTFVMDSYSGKTYAATTMLADGLKLYADSSNTVAADASNKTFEDVKYTTRLKMGGIGKFDGTTPTARVLEILPQYDGKVKVFFAHASSSGDDRALAAMQNGVDIAEQSVSAGGLATLEADVKGGSSVYIYGKASVNIYAVIYEIPEPSTEAPTLDPNATPGPSPTPDPDADLTPDEKAVKADAAALQLNTLNQTAIYFDIDLDRSGSNGSTITWESSNTDYIDIQMVSHIKRNYTGVVTRPKPDDENMVDNGVPVTLTATLTKGDAVLTKEFDVSVRVWNPNVYYNDFEADVNNTGEDGYKVIADNVIPSNPDAAPFRGIRVDTFKDSKAFADFNHNDVDTSVYFDKRIMSTDALYGKPADSDEGENFAFYYSEYNPFGGTEVIPIWVTLTDQNTGEAPEGIVMMSMDIYVVNGNNQFNIGFANSSPSKMVRFMLGKDASATRTFSGKSAEGDAFSYPAVGYIRCFSNESNVDFMGGTAGYRYPKGEWLKVTIVANSDSHKWDLYFDGMQMATGLDFRNAEDMISNIDFTMNRSYPATVNGVKEPVAAYIIDNIYVENLTDDYSAAYWNAIGIDSLPYDEETDTYTATAGVPFLLQYQGTDALSGNSFKWTSSNKAAISIKAQNIPVDDLLKYGYSQEQVQGYKNSGLNDVAVILATPGNVTSDTTVTLTASMTAGETDLEKEFTVIVKPGEAGDATPAPTATVKPSTPSSGGGGGGGGGGSSSGSSSSGVSGGSIATSTNTGVTAAATAAPEATKRPEGVEAFTDLTLTEWAREAVMYLYEKDVVDGYGDGTFGVNDNVTREQFVKILLTAYNLPIYKHETTSFTDIEEGTWYEPYVETAVRMGIVKGISDTEFGIGQPISRQDIAVMCMRMIDLINSDIEIPTEEELTDDFAPVIEDGTVEISEDVIEPDEVNADETSETAETEAAEADEAVSSEDSVSEDTGEESAEGLEEAEALEAALQKQLEIENAIANLSFNDKGSITDYALAAVARMAAAGYVTGDDLGNFNPVKISTRAETAAMIYRMIK
ncbi:MAG: S-layer homology domain-containing protein [Candidatus Ornithomonoglobus sp.]